MIINFSFWIEFLWLINKLLLFGVKHYLIVRFQVYFYRSEFFARYCDPPCIKPLVISIATCCPALCAKEMLVPSPAPIFAIASFAASCSSDEGTESPFARHCRKRQSSTGMILPAYSSEDTSMSSRSPVHFGTS